MDVPRTRGRRKGRAQVADNPRPSWWEREEKRKNRRGRKKERGHGFDDCDQRDPREKEEGRERAEILRRNQKCKEGRKDPAVPDSCERRKEPAMAEGFLPIEGGKSEKRKERRESPSASCTPEKKKEESVRTSTYHLDLFSGSPDNRVPAHLGKEEEGKGGVHSLGDRRNDEKERLLPALTAITTNRKEEGGGSKPARREKKKRGRACCRGKKGGKGSRC